MLFLVTSAHHVSNKLFNLAEYLDYQLIMAGIYFHIPFCKQACHYCNFHFSTSLRLKNEFLSALLKEIELQQNYLDNEPVETIYFGGGTPSLLGEQDLKMIFDKIFELHAISPNPEITLEANPDDLSIEKLQMLKNTPVNRLSIGVQSFFDEDLKFMNRAHDVRMAQSSIQNAQKAGFENITIDLIYGAPTTTDARWLQNLEIFFGLGVPHLSAYCLTIEPRTALANFVAKGKVPDVDDEKTARQFDLLMDTAKEQGFEHYEISNFARPGRHSRHNSAYWQGKKYLGLGPSAHSFDGKSRQWNIANNAKYIAALEAGKVPFEMEVLTPAQRYNEYVMTTLRTQWGCDVEKIEAPFQTHFLQTVQSFLKEGLVEKEREVFRLTKSGKFMADSIAAALFA